jgi:pyrroloquinoline quinone biosynthesis protein E
MRLKNLLKMGTATLAANLTGTATPLNVMISVTNRCPARCSYCNIPNRQQREMTTEEIISLFDELKSLGTQRIALWGGEPLIRDDIGYLIDYAKNRCGFFVSIDTNGYLLPEKIAEISPLDVVVISFDGPREVHDENREPGSYDKVMAALRTACQHHNVFTITVLTNKNIDHIDFILETSREIGFATTFQLPHHTKCLASEDEQLLLSENDAYRGAIRHLIKRKREGYPIVSSYQYLNSLLKWEDYRQYVSAKKQGLTCWAGRLYCNVDTDGSVYPCSGTIGTMPAKNFLEVGFGRAFAAIGEPECKSCIASCFTEYNYMHSFQLGVIWNWMRYTGKRKHGRKA